MDETENRITEMLSQFRPVGPPADLRQRVLAKAGRAAARPPARGRALDWVFRGAVAATLAVAVCLSFAADRITHRQAAMIGIGPAVWDEQAEQIAQLLGGDGWGRHYVALGLMASGARGTAPDASYPGDSQ